MPNAEKMPKNRRIWPFSAKIGMPNMISHDLIGVQLSAPSRRGASKISEVNPMTTAKIIDKKSSKKA